MGLMTGEASDLAVEEREPGLQRGRARLLRRYVHRMVIDGVVVAVQAGRGRLDASGKGLRQAIGGRIVRAVAEDACAVSLDRTVSLRYPGGTAC